MQCGCNGNDTRPTPNRQVVERLKAAHTSELSDHMTTKSALHEAKTRLVELQSEMESRWADRQAGRQALAMAVIGRFGGLAC